MDRKEHYCKCPKCGHICHEKEYKEEYIGSFCKMKSNNIHYPDLKRYIVSDSKHDIVCKCKNCSELFYINALNKWVVINELKFTLDCFVGNQIKLKWDSFPEYIYKEKKTQKKSTEKITRKYKIETIVQCGSNEKVYFYFEDNNLIPEIDLPIFIDKFCFIISGYSFVLNNDYEKDGYYILFGILKWIDDYKLKLIPEDTIDFGWKYVKDEN